MEKRLINLNAFCGSALITQGLINPFKPLESTITLVSGIIYIYFAFAWNKEFNKATNK